MSANIKNILHDHEAPPPPGAWESISARLDAEFAAQDARIADKLYHWESAPPAAAWQSIAIALQVNETAPSTPAKVISLPVKKLAIAAAILAVVGFATWRFLSIQGGEPMVGPSQEASILPAITDDPDRNVQPSLPIIDAAIGGRPKRRIDIAKRVNGAGSIRPNYGNHMVPEEITSNIRYAAMDDLRAEATTIRRGVKAPLIKDGNGNIILDKSLIVSQDKNYIIITGPNGEQTRLSAKFLPVLTDLNTPMDPAEFLDAIFRENTLWKGRFLQWRYKLMQEASFTPTATNFLDIMALKDLIEEK